MDLCWFVFKWGLGLALVAALAASPFYYRQIFFRVEEQVRSRVEARLAEQFPQMQVQVRSAHLAADGIEIRGVSLFEPGVTGPQPEVLYLDQIFLTCQTSLQELAAGDPQITEVKLTRPVVRMTRRPDGTFCLAKLLAGPKSDKPLPAVTIEDGVVEIFDPLKNPSSTLTMRDVQVTLRPSGDGKNLEVQGYVVGDHVQCIKVVGTVDPAAKRWSMSGTVDGLQVSPELRSSLPEPFAKSLEVLAGVRAPANLSFRASADGPNAAPTFEVNGSVDGGRIEHPLLPYPLTDLTARIHCDNGGFRIRQLSARHGPTTWEVAQFDRQGYAPDSPCILRASGRQVRLDRAWRDALTPEWRKYWTNYEPEGDIDLDCTLTFDGRAWKPALRLTALDNVSFRCYKFPYKLERARGSLTLADQQLDIDVVAYSGAQPVTLKGRFFNPGPQYSGSIEIWGEKIQFDEALFAAILKEKSRATIRSLNPRGTFDVHARLWRDVNDLLPRPLIHQHLQVSLNRCGVTYEKFPYPLGNLQGRLDMRDGQWTTATEIVGANDTGVVTVTGSLTPSPQMDVLALHIDAKNVPLEEELRDALPPAQQQIWNALRPRGNVDLVAEVGYNSQVRKPSIDLQIVPRDDATSMGTSIEPVSFPYRMDKLGGMVHYRDGQAELKELRAVHRQTTLRANGRCSFQADGAWRLQLERLAVDRIRLHGEDHELEAALPAALRRAVSELRPTGAINMKGRRLDFGKRGANLPLETAWDVDLFLHQAGVQIGPRLENVSGCVRLQGSSNGSKYTSFGELKLDSLMYKNFQFTQILGPLWFDNENVYLGTLPYAPPRGQQAGRVTANLFGGVVSGDCRVRLGAVPQYHLVASLAGADLRQFAAENLSGPTKLNGKILANVDLQGSRGQHTLVGRGDIHLTDADVYELPLVVSLLKIVSAKRPDNTAFTESDIVFQINGQHVELSAIDLRGDAISLSGHGELTLDSQTNPIRLELHTMVGRGGIPLLSGARALFSEASQQIMKIHVEGTIDHPSMRTEAFPVAGEALERLREGAAVPPQASLPRR